MAGLLWEGVAQSQVTESGLFIAGTAHTGSPARNRLRNVEERNHIACGQLLGLMHASSHQRALLMLDVMRHVWCGSTSGCITELRGHTLGDTRYSVAHHVAYRDSACISGSLTARDGCSGE